MLVRAQTLVRFAGRMAVIAAGFAGLHQALRNTTGIGQRHRDAQDDQYFDQKAGHLASD